jgi:glycosyltransferase involved in cell wall biosynthesis
VNLDPSSIFDPPSSPNLLRGLKICFIAGTLGQGGAERQLFYMLKCLKESGALVNLLTLSKGEYWEGKIRELGVPVVWVGQSPSRIGRVVRIVKELRRCQPDLVQCSHFYANLYAVIASRLLGLREIGAIRGDVFGELKANGFLMGSMGLKSPRWLAANSQLAIGNALRKGVAKGRCHLLPNVVDTDHFTPMERLGKGVVRLLFVGRLSAEKRADRFLEVLAEARNVCSARIQGVIVGGGPLASELRERAKGLGLGVGAVEFQGVESDMVSTYRRADILVLTSDSEGTPNVVMEASACGLPVVATRAGGTPEVVRNGETGYLFEIGDKSGLAAALVKLACNVGLRAHLGEQGRRFVVRNHSLQVLPTHLANLYVKIMNRLGDDSTVNWSSGKVPAQ